MSEQQTRQERQRLLHYVSLDGAGGVEFQFVEFIQRAARLYGDHHTVMACGRRVHPLVQPQLAATGAETGYEKYWRGMKLPKWPPAVRAARQRLAMSRTKPDAVIIWNRLRDSLNTLAAAGADRCVYWERGASWFASETPAKRRFLADVQAVLCNSYAAQRMLQLRWDYQGQTRVCFNALRPSLRPDHAEVRQLAHDRPLRLGVVARLEPIKGVALAIQALAALRAERVDAVLHIAGDGPERARLEGLARRLGVAEQVTFAGLVADMGAFYRGIDVLIHPALREPFGQIAVEAGAHGCPSIVAAVDGLPEVVRHGETGLCVVPELPVEDYAALGGAMNDLPPYVYDPAADDIVAPRLVDPQSLAQAVRSLLAEPDRYATMSEQALAAIDTRFDFDVHVANAMQAIRGFAGHGDLHHSAEPRV